MENGGWELYPAPRSEEEKKAREKSKDKKVDKLKREGDPIDHDFLVLGIIPDEEGRVKVEDPAGVDDGG